jgi:hypothetical protein
MAMLAIITLSNRSFHSSAVKLDLSAIGRTSPTNRRQPGWRSRGLIWTKIVSRASLSRISGVMVGFPAYLHPNTAYHRFRLLEHRT